MTAMQYYRELLAQPGRIEAFRGAINAVVRPADSVLEIGSGLGTFAFFAADAGATRVWAVDGDPVIHVAKAIARINGYEDRVEFIRGWIPDVDLPQPATVILFEDFPPRLVDAQMFRILKLVRTKYAAPTARYIPGHATMHIAPITAFRNVLDAVGPQECLYDIDWSASREYAAHAVHYSRATPEMMVGEPAKISTIDFSHGVNPADLGGRATWTLPAGTVVDALAYWFDLELAPGIDISNAPGSAPASWGHCVLPLDSPVTVGNEGSLAAAVGPEVRAGEPSWMRWSVKTRSEERRGHEFRSFPASTADLLAGSPDARPRLSARGRLAARALELADGTVALREIARRLAPDAGDHVTQSDAERLVAQVLMNKIENGHVTEGFDD